MKLNAADVARNSHSASTSSDGSYASVSIGLWDTSGELRDGGSSDLVYHEAMLKKTIDSMGYNSRSVNEGLAVVFAEMEAENFTGIGISCGGGMCNVALGFMSMPVITFSITKAGDYIDSSVASVTGETANSVRTIKESGLDLSRSPLGRPNFEEPRRISTPVPLKPIGARRSYRLIGLLS